VLANALLQSAVAAPPVPALPTPCVGGLCTNGTGKNLPFVQSGMAGATLSGNALTVNQSSNKAILNWQNFNIGSGNSVTFNQPSSTAATLNRIWDGNPSTIAGKLTANGQIYLINQNGIVFANGAQVNVGSLTAATADLKDSTFLNGLLSGNTSNATAGGYLAPVFDATLNSSGKQGDVTVESGAQIISKGNNGRVMLVGASVMNQGSISTPDGQTILAAGNKVYLASTTDPSMRGLLVEVDGGGASGNSTSAVTNQGQISAPRGNITLAGFAVNQEGLVSATSSVNANGSIYLVAGDASAPADNGVPAKFYNIDPKVGSYDPDANKSAMTQGELLPNVGGKLTLAPGSVTEITADKDTATITDSQKFYSSQINLVGKTIEVLKNATVRAPAAALNAVAAANPYDYVSKIDAQTVPAQSDGSRIYLDSGSDIDLSGMTGVKVSAARNLVDIRLGANELEDDPLLRDSFLHGSTVTVDVTKGTPLLNAATLQSYRNNIGRGIDEKLTRGGSINLSAAGDVITRAGSVQNVSGGSVAYQAAVGKATTQLLGADGKVYDITNAPNNVQYTGFADQYSYIDQRWGTVSSWKASSTALIAAYTEGADAGGLAVQAPQVYLRGNMLAETSPGVYQRSAATLPQGGSFTLGAPVAKQDLATASTNRDAPSILFADGATDDLGNFDPLTADLPNAGRTVISLTGLGNAGFNRIGLYSNGTITQSAGSSGILPGNGSLTLDGRAINLNGVIRAPSSALTLVTEFALTTANLSQEEQAAAATTTNSIVLGDRARLDTSGVWVNDSPLVTTLPGTAPTFINGGSISLSAYNDVRLGKSILDVSGGGWVNVNNHLTPGNGGSINLRANVGQPTQNGSAVSDGVDLSGATLLGASLGSGGKLSVTSAWVTVSGSGQGSGNQGELVLPPDFFTKGGFSQYNVTGINGVTIGSADGTAPVTISPLQQNLAFTSNMLLQPTGTDWRSFTTLTTLPSELRQPANVSFSSTASSFGVPGLGYIRLNPGSSIVTDPGASVALSARESLFDFGSIFAPAGRITLQLAPGIPLTSSDDDGYVPNQELLVASGARLLAPGYAAIYTDNNPRGYRQGQVLAAGSITLIANKGSVVVQSGSVLDVSGASGTVDIVNGSGATAVAVAGQAGSIDIEARENIVLNGTLTAAPAPVTGASGGSLTVALVEPLYETQQFNQNNQSIQYNTADRNVTITSVPLAALPDTLTLDQNGNTQDGLALVSTSAFSGGGFTNLTFRSSGTVVLDGSLNSHVAQQPLTLSAVGSITLDAPDLAATSGTHASIKSPYVALGTRFYSKGAGNVAPSGDLLRPYEPVASGNDTTLAVDAGLIDLRGKSSLDGFDTAIFHSTGDIRLTYATAGGVAGDATDFTGWLKSAASLTFSAAQIYPTTNTQFTINPTSSVNFGAPPALDPQQIGSYAYLPGSVTICGSTCSAPASSAPAVPLSALGSLTIDSPQVNQYGVIRAPFGQITLNGVNGSGGQPGRVELFAGSVTSVSAQGQTIPYGTTQNGQQWTYPLDSSGDTALVSTLPAKEVSLNADRVAVDPAAKVNLAGGGDLYAYEFIAGTGGSKDVLDPANGTYNYAILPGFASKYAPIDQLYSVGSNIAPGEQVFLTGVPGLATGYYTLLPARYALLPGAYGVRVVKANSDIPASSAVRQPDGSYLAAGRYAVAGTDNMDSRTSSFLLTPGNVVRTQSQYNDSYANVFFTAAAVTAKARAANLPADAGQLQIGATEALTLNGALDFAPAQFVSGKDSSGNPLMSEGRGGSVSIQATQLEVVDQVGTADGFLQLTANSLNDLGATSIILGATRTTTAKGDQLSVGASNVRVDAGAGLSAPEIILAATGSVDLEGSLTTTSTASVTSRNSLNVTGDGSLVRLANGPQVAISRTLDPNATPAGTLTIGQKASIGPDSTTKTSSLILDAAADTKVVNGAQIKANAVTASSNRISLGDVPTDAGGLDISAQLLSNFSGLTELTLHSYSTIDFYAVSGPIKLGTANQAGGQSIPVLQNITLDARGIAGYGTADTVITAGSIVLSNNADTQSTAPFNTAPNGTGHLILNALSTGKSTPAATAGTATPESGQIDLASGVKDIQGFGGGVTLSAAGDIRGRGTGTLNFTDSGTLSLTSARISTDNGASQNIVNTGAVVISSASSPATGATLADPGLGSRFAIIASAITQNGTIDLPAGNVSLQANTGDLTLEGGAAIEVAGVARQYFDSYAVAPGGSVSLASLAGSVSVGTGATIDVSGVTAADGKTSGDAGSLTILVPQGSLSIGGTLKGTAAAGQLQGSFTLDAASIRDASGGSPGDLAYLNHTLAADGFLGDISIRDRADTAVTLGDTVKANSFELSADSGSITVAGKIDTSSGTAENPTGGSIGLWSAGDLTIASGAILNTSAGKPIGDAPARGGNISLGSTHGYIDVQAATIDMHGNASQSTNINTGVSPDGQLTLRAARTADNTDVQIREIGATINSAKPIIVEGVRVYQGVTAVDASTQFGGSTLGFGDGSQLYSDTTTFAGNSASIAQRLATTNILETAIQVQAGVEVQSAGDMAVTQDIDLNHMHSVVGAPVDLTLRAAGNLTFSASLSDGFTNPGSGAVSGWALAGGSSGSHRLAAGADLNAANPLAIRAGAGNFELEAGHLIRTGTGNIDIAAGGNIKLDAQTAVIYTAGVPTTNFRDFVPPSAFSGTPFSEPEYPVGGGDISLTADGDIVGARTTNLTSNWLWRAGPSFQLKGTDTTQLGTTWWIEFNQFQQGVGALGGGDIRVRAGGSVTNLNVAIPTTGWLSSTATTSNPVVNGGGNLSVNAGKDILSGTFEDDLGRAMLSAGGSIRSAAAAGDASGTKADAILLLADSVFNLSALGDVNIEAATNTTAFAEATNNANVFSNTTAKTYFYTYSPSSTLNVTSVGGDVSFDNNATAVTSGTKGLDLTGSAKSGIINVYPANLRVSALSGDFTLNALMQMFPAATGNLSLLAEGNVNLLAPLQMDETDPSLVAGVANPGKTLQAVNPALVNLLPLVPLHQSDQQPAEIIAATGSIIGAPAGQLITLPKAAYLVAGQDITNLDYAGKNLNAAEVTLFEAGGDITYQTTRSPDTQQLSSNSNGITVAGPGYVDVLAGGTLDLGNGKGLVTTGNFTDSRLPGNGASLVVGAGFGANSDGGLRAPAYDSFISTYLAPAKNGAPSAYAAQLVSYMSQLYPDIDANLSSDQALAAFDALPRQQQLPFISRVLSDELNATGLAHTQTGASYDRGYQAIARLFPTKDAQGNALAYKGDINLFFSQIKTEEGGDINLLAPGGAVVVGVPNPPAALVENKVDTNFIPPLSAEANLGILVLASGAVRGFANGDFDVNQSRILTLQGGDIILWSSYGNIDAGKGATTAQGAPPPVIQTDKNGNLFVNPVGAVTGSGIGQLLTIPGMTGGLVNLIAPTGFVNAGDAGIRVAGNLNIAAVQVLNAGNIKVGGTTSGVPVSDAGALSGSLSGANALGDAGKQVADQLSQSLNSSNTFQQLTETLQPTFIVVKMFCLGVQCDTQ